MIVSVVSGNLADVPKVAYHDAQRRPVYKVRFGSSTYKLENKQRLDATVWVSALVPEKHIKNILPYLTKGVYVVVVTTDTFISMYQRKDGNWAADLDMRHVAKFEAGNLNRQQGGQLPSGGQQYPSDGIPALANQPGYNGQGQFTGDYTNYNPQVPVHSPPQQHAQPGATSPQGFNPQQAPHAPLTQAQPPAGHPASAPPATQDNFGGDSPFGATAPWGG